MRVAVAALLLAAGCGRVGFSELLPDSNRVVDAAVISDATPSGLCAPGFTSLAGAPNRYFFEQTLQTWADAVASCAAFGEGHQLATITSNAERLAINQQQALLDPIRYWWVNGNDETSDGSWISSDGTTLTYLPWGDGEPNNSGGGEHCLSLLNTTEQVARAGYLNDTPCFETYPSVCQCVE